MIETALLDDKDKYFVFRNHDILTDFLNWQLDQVNLDVGNLIRSAIPYDRWDHHSGTCLKTIHGMALIQMQFKNIAPLFAHSRALSEYSQTLFSAFDDAEEKDQTLIVNFNGGYQIVENGRLSVYEDYDVSAPNALHITEGTNVLVLENDPVLDPWTVANLPGKYSYITSLRKFSPEQLKRAIMDFGNQIPRGKTYTLFVYTTGIDGLQMQSYVELAISLGFMKFVFVQSAGDGPAFDTAKEYIRSEDRECFIFDENDPALVKYLNVMMKEG